MSLKAYNLLARLRDVEVRFTELDLDMIHFYVQESDREIVEKMLNELGQIETRIELMKRHLNGASPH